MIDFKLNGKPKTGWKNSNLTFKCRVKPVTHLSIILDLSVCDDGFLADAVGWGHSKHFNVKCCFAWFGFFSFDSYTKYPYLVSMRVVAHFGWAIL